MGKLRYIVIAVLVVGVLATSGCGLFTEDESPSAQGTPISVDWQPGYVDDQRETDLPIGELVDRIGPTVVSILTEKVSLDVFLRPVPQQGAGTGVIIDAEGIIVTNNHVIEGTSKINVTLSDGSSYRAEKWAGDLETDLAVLKIGPGEELPYAHFLRDSLNQLEKLEDVVAVGNALALPGGPSWTKGVISYLGRSIQEPNGVVLTDIIQTDAAINPGNSGGPLVNMAGQVVGINTAIAEGENLGFAISTNVAISVVYDLVTKARVSPAWLGVSITDVTPAVKSQWGLSVEQGALVVEVVEGGPAEGAGLQAGDVIIKLGDADVTTVSELVNAIRSHEPGEKVTITYVRGDVTDTTEAVLGQRP